MSKNMYNIAGDCPSNEDLALRIQAGDRKAADLLISQNEGYLTELALKHTEWCEIEDLKQEGAMALLEAAKQFDPSYGTKLLTYATPAIESAMMDYGTYGSLSISIPPSRYHQLRKVAYVCAEAQDESEPALIDAVCKELEVSPKVATKLLKEYQTVFNIWLLGDRVNYISYGGDPAKAYDRYMRQVLLLQLMENVLKPRERNLVRYYLGIGQPDEKGMTFQELAIRLNYNGHSGAEKAYKSALRKLKKDLYSGAYGQWLSIQKAINKARAEAEADPGDGRKILCKRFSTKSRIALENRANSGLNPLFTESHGGQNGMRAGTA